MKFDQGSKDGFFRWLNAYAPDGMDPYEAKIREVKKSAPDLRIVIPGIRCVA